MVGEVGGVEWGYERLGGWGYRYSFLNLLSVLSRLKLTIKVSTLFSFFMFTLVLLFHLCNVQQ